LEIEEKNEGKLGGIGGENGDWKKNSVNLEIGKKMELRSRNQNGE
jgi:hypothetical protein